MRIPDLSVPAASATPASFLRTIPFHCRPQALPRRTRALLWAAMGAMLAIAGPVALAGAPLTLTEAQHQAVQRSRQIAGQDAAVAASRDMAVAASRLPDPVLRLGIDNMPINGADQFSLTRDSMTMRRIGVMQEFTRSEKRQLRAQRFAGEAEKSLAIKAATIASVQRDTALAWLERYYAETMAAVLAQQATEVRREILAVEGAYRGGRGTQADVFAAHSALAGLEDQVSEIDRRIRTATSDLARWVGEGADAPLAGKPAIDAIRLDTGSLDTALAHHPELAVLRGQEQVATAEARIAQAEKKADWSLEVTYSQRGPSYSNMVSIGVSIPLQWDQANRQNREQASKLALAEQARAEHDEALRAHIAEVRAMVAQWENGRERLRRYERELTPLAGERSRAALAAYQGGKASLTDLLLARRDEIEVRLRAVELEAEVARVWAQLNFLFPDTGEAVPGGVPPPTSAMRTEGPK